MVFSDYLVPDLAICPARVRLVLLFESPYHEEVRHGHPLAGKTGVSVSEFMACKVEAFKSWNSRVPFGCQLKKERFAHVAVLNCSQFPMEPGAYDCAVRAEESSRIADLRIIRNDPQAATCGRRGRTACVEAWIVKDLKGRLEKVLSSRPLVVPCGRVARELLGKTGLEVNACSCIVPHPARNWWHRKSCLSDLRHLADEINATLGVEK